MLTEEEIGAFARDGFVAVRGAVTVGLARECQAAVWAELESQGVLRDDPATWTAPVVRISCPEGGPFAVAGTVPRLWEAYDQLIGAGRWWRRHGVGGTIPVRFPGCENGVRHSGTAVRTDMDAAFMSFQDMEAASMSYPRSRSGAARRNRRVV